MDGIWHLSTKEHSGVHELLHLDDIKEETTIKKDVEDEIFERQIRLTDETWRDRKDNRKNELLNLSDVKAETTIEQKAEDICIGKIELTNRTWCFPDKEDHKQNELINSANIKEETIVKTEIESNFESEVKFNVNNTVADANEHPFECLICDKQFVQKLDLTNHVRAHRTVYKCPMCLKEFSKKVYLDEHMPLHKPFKCKTCGKCFTQRASLNRHIYVHTKEYECHVCQKIFSRNDHLDEHMLVHTGERPFKCETCGQKFSRK
ncbi:gastrula zinc finger protein XlCGF7.1-like [Agrilus planipennis]|uniref:Gastrula zinc finger protein XlCGF7.1-like n=1 Tax=Agrilus planipennis TaxID=224129 RepID=A0A7F5R3U5_AGRPL|nr:gastrula zinc finger protein XlCGF7.1-like [Agrilus planipennis]